MLLYGLGRYTIVFHWLYDYVPGMGAAPQEQADATYALGPMAAITAATACICS